MPRVLVLIGSLVALVCVLAAPAGASQLIARDATNVRLSANNNGMALVSYRSRGKSVNLLAWGGINAIPPTKGRYQTKLQLDYSGGWGTFRKQVWKTFKNACGPYRGPQLAWLVTACTMPDGSHWALQSWQRNLPNVGEPPPDWIRGAWELRLSHWNSDLPQLEINLDWARKKYHHLWGRYTYLGQAVYGFRVTRTGKPLDTWARNIYVDTFNSAYGRGWKRENSFLSHNPSGVFCYGVYPNQANGRKPAGTGEWYRATASGPGVTPDVFWQGRSPGPFDALLDQQANEIQRAFFGADKICKPN